MLLAAISVGTVGLGGCSTSSYESNSDNGWLSGYQADKNKDGALSQGEVNDAFVAADRDGNGSLSGGERGGGGR
jgi:EF hand